jgi:hypothetical protein
VVLVLVMPLAESEYVMRNEKLPDRVDSTAPAKPHVRYLGFESINSGRRLRFRVKSNRDELLDVMLDIADAVLVGTPGISIQDAAPMAYEKLVGLLAEGTLESENLCLTSEDIARYVNRHMSSQKRLHSNIAA